MFKKIAKRILKNEFNELESSNKYYKNTMSRYITSYSMLFDFNKDNIVNTNNIIEKVIPLENLTNYDLYNCFEKDGMIYTILRNSEYENKEVIIVDNKEGNISIVTKDGYSSLNCDNSIIKKEENNV